MPAAELQVRWAALVPSRRVLKSVAHNVLEYATGPLSSLVPKLFQVAKEASISTVCVDVLAGEISPSLDTAGSLRRVTDALTERFLEILAAEGFARDAVVSATIAFDFETSWPDTPTVRRAITRAVYAETETDPAYHCRAVVVGADGRPHQHALASWHYHDL